MAVCGIPQAPALSSSHLFDGRFGFCLSLSRDGDGFLYATLMLGFFTLCILIWDFAMTFQEYRKALLYEEIELASPLEHLLYENIQKNSRRAWSKAK